MLPLDQTNFLSTNLTYFSHPKNGHHSAAEAFLEQPINDIKSLHIKRFNPKRTVIKRLNRALNRNKKFS